MGGVDLSRLIESTSERYRADMRSELDKAVNHLDEKMEDMAKQLSRVEGMLRDVKLATNSGPLFGIAHG